MPAIAGLFENHTAAEPAIDELYQLGFDDDEIEVVFRNDQAVGDERRTDNAGIDVGEIGALPIIERERAAGLIGTFNTGGVAGLHDALRGMGIPDDEAQFYAQTINRGDAVLVVVTADLDEEPEVREVLSLFGARTAGD